VAEQRLGGDRLAGTLITADFFYSKKPLVIRRRRRGVQRRRDRERSDARGA
jgi:hypothetical protein